MLFRTFQREVARNCQYILTSDADMQTALRSGDTARFWMAAQTLATAAANVSKAFWGLRGAREGERQPLRESFGVSDTSCLRPTTFRNHFEHFDQRLEEWWEKSTRHNFADENIGPIGGADERDMLRNFDPRTGTLTFWGDTFSIPDITAEAELLLANGATELSKAPWEE
jgi:hypothetical protein